MNGSTEDEFSEFVRVRTPDLMRSAYLLVLDWHLAQDLVQAALIRTHRAWGRLHLGGHAEAYTRRAMYHIHISWWRRRRLNESLVDSPPEPGRRGGPDVAGAVVTRMMLRAALAKLTKSQRAVLVLRFFEDLSEAETAELLGVGIGTVKSQTSKALARLRIVSPELAERYFPGAQR